MTTGRYIGEDGEDGNLGAAAEGRVLCAHPDCQEAGEFRAPRSRSELHSYYWFCLEHVREYNAAWNYYAGMEDSEIEAEIRADTVWRRPSWPLGSRASTNPANFGDPLGLMAAQGIAGDAHAATAERQRRLLTAAERQALDRLGLRLPVTAADVKIRYKALVKVLHPDANGGDKNAEERLKLVNHAYTTLRQCDRL